MKKIFKKTLEVILSICCAACLVMMVGEAPGFGQVLLTGSCMALLVVFGKVIDKITD